jgi:hypothetical protein
MTEAGSYFIHKTNGRQMGRSFEGDGHKDAVHEVWDAALIWWVKNSHQITVEQNLFHMYGGGGNVCSFP